MMAKVRIGRYVYDLQGDDLPLAVSTAFRGFIRSADAAAAAEDIRRAVENGVRAGTLHGAEFRVGTNAGKCPQSTWEVVDD